MANFFDRFCLSLRSSLFNPTGIYSQCQAKLYRIWDMAFDQPLPVVFISRPADDQSGSCRGQDQAREGSLLGREATWGRMLLNGLGRGLSGANGRQHRGGQACRCPIGGFRGPTISAYFPLSDSLSTRLPARRAFPYLCYMIINQCPSDFLNPLYWPVFVK